jgi:O-antigen ligase
MVETANVALLLIGFILVAMSFHNFTRAFAIWWALFPLVMRLTPIEGVVIPTCRLITSSLFLVAIFRFQGRRHRFPHAPLWKSYVLFLVLAAISAAISFEPMESLGKAFTYVEPLMWAVMSAWCVLSDQRAMKTITKGMLWGLTGVIAYALVEIITQRSLLYDIGLLRAEADYISEIRFSFSGRIMSTIGQPVATSLYLISVLPLALLYSKNFTRSVVTKLICYLIMAAGLVCLIATGSRTGYFAILLLPIAYFIFNWSRWRTMLAVLSVYALFFVVVQYVLPPDFLTYNLDSIQVGAVDPRNAAVGNVLGRIDLTERLLDMAPDNPFFGLGPGAVPRLDLAGSPEFFGLSGSENQFAMLLAETGIVGLTGYIIFILVALRLLLSVRKHKAAAKAQSASFIGSVFVSILVVSISVTVIASIMMMLVMTFLGMAVVFRKEDNALPYSPQQKKRWLGRRTQLRPYQPVAAR